MLFRRVKVITILLMVFMMSIGCSRRKEVSIEPKKETKTTAEKSSSKETIYVYVCGEENIQEFIVFRKVNVLFLL